jgi:hypothetical protein
MRLEVQGAELIQADHHREPPDSATDLLLQGYTARVTGGYAAAVPALRRAIHTVGSPGPSSTWPSAIA